MTPQPPTRRIRLGVAAASALLIGATAAATGAAAAQPDTTFGNGTHVVGEDIAPGTYQAVVPDGSFGCYWARVSALTGDLDAILANHNVEGGDLATVTIGTDDAGFESRGCGTWQPSEEAGPSTPATSFGGGTWIVGEDIQPGTYRATVPDDAIGCYWARLDDFSGELEGIVANGNLEAGDPVTVDIGADDAGFESNSCGTWELTG